MKKTKLLKLVQNQLLQTTQSASADRRLLKANCLIACISAPPYLSWFIHIFMPVANYHCICLGQLKNADKGK